MFAWLVTMVLREAPRLVGVAQMCMLIPAMIFMLIGGSLSDRFGGRKIATISQSLAIVPATMLLIVLMSDHLSFRIMVVYALMMGCAQAFVTPARDGLLQHVSEGRIQRTVVFATLIQFSSQPIGFLIAGLADHIGPQLVVCAQILFLLAGVIAYQQIPVTQYARRLTQDLVSRIVASIRVGWRSVIRSPPMRTVSLLNVATGILFMGSYIVTIPLLVREYGGSASDLAMLNAANSVGLVSTILVLLRIGDVRRQGRALLIAQALGAIFLSVAGLGLGFEFLFVCLFLWGITGGVVMTMVRTIMQEQAPEGQRGRVMAFFSFSFMGAGPIGALANGYLVDWIGPSSALLCCASTMGFVAVTVGIFSKLWQLDQRVAIG